ncbi:MAG: transposase [Myxococcales bacterium]|nr:transposase [Myxococcales bacterium]
MLVPRRRSWRWITCFSRRAFFVTRDGRAESAIVSAMFWRSLPWACFAGTTTHAAVITGARIVLAECAVDTSANEITTAPDLLRALELRGVLVSGDAMYTQTALADQIVQAGGITSCK